MVQRIGPGVYTNAYRGLYREILRREERCGEQAIMVNDAGNSINAYRETDRVSIQRERDTFTCTTCSNGNTKIK